MKRNTGFKMKLTLLLAAAAGFVAGKWGNQENKERIVQRFKAKTSEQKTRIISKSQEATKEEVLLDEYEMLSYHN